MLNQHFQSRNRLEKMVVVAKKEGIQQTRFMMKIYKTFIQTDGIL